MNKIKQLIKITDVMLFLESAILCLQEKEKHSFVTTNKDFIRSMFGIDFLEEESHKAFDILNKKVIDFYPEGFNGKIFSVCSFGGFEFNDSDFELNINKDLFSTKNEEANVQLMHIVKEAEHPYIFNVYFNEKIDLVVVDKFGRDSYGNKIISNKNIFDEVEGYVMLSEHRGPISYSKKFSDEYLSIADYKDLGLEETDNKMVLPSVIYLNESKLIDIQILNTLGACHD